MLIEWNTVDVGTVNAISATPWSNVLQEVFSGTVGAGPTATTIKDTSLPGGDDNWWVGRIIIFLASATVGYQASNITAFNHTTQTLTFTTLTRAPATGDKYVIV